MRGLNWELKKLADERGSGAFVSRRDRSYVLRGVANELHRLGFKGLRAEGIRRKHVVALVRSWERRGLSAGTMKNRLAQVRWWAKEVGHPRVVPSNAELGIERRTYVTNEDKSRDLDAEKLAAVRDPYVAMSLRLQAELGLRREESIKFTPSYADRGDRVVIKESWAKGGRRREIAVWTDGQRQVLREARQLAGSGALIGPGRNYRMQRDVYVAACRAVGFDKMHGLRHAYAQRRYEAMTGWRCPALGGPGQRSLRGEDREVDRRARQAIAEELGHGRIEVAAQYLGS